MLQLKDGERGIVTAPPQPRHDLWWKISANIFYICTGELHNVELPKITFVTSWRLLLRWSGPTAFITHHGHPMIKTCTTSTHKRHQWRFKVNNNVHIPQTQTIFHSLERSRLNKQNRDNDISRLANFVQVRRRFSTCKSVIIINGVTTSLRGRVLHRYRFRLSEVKDTSLCQMETHTAVTLLQTYIWKANPITYAHAC